MFENVVIVTGNTILSIENIIAVLLGNRNNSIFDNNGYGKINNLFKFKTLKNILDENKNKIQSNQLLTSPVIDKNARPKEVPGTEETIVSYLDNNTENSQQPYGITSVSERGSNNLTPYMDVDEDEIVDVDEDEIGGSRKKYKKTKKFTRRKNKKSPKRKTIKKRKMPKRKNKTRRQRK